MKLNTPTVKKFKSLCEVLTAYKPSFFFLHLSFREVALRSVLIQLTSNADSFNSRRVSCPAED